MTIFFSSTAISRLVISTHNSFRGCLIKLLPYILFEKCINILALGMISLGNRHCASCIGALSFPMSEFYSYRRVFVTFYTRAFVLTSSAARTQLLAELRSIENSSVEWSGLWERAGGSEGRCSDTVVAGTSISAAYDVCTDPPTAASAAAPASSTLSDPREPTRDEKLHRLQLDVQSCTPQPTSKAVVGTRLTVFIPSIFFGGIPPKKNLQFPHRLPNCVLYIFFRPDSKLQIYHGKFLLMDKTQEIIRQ